MFGVFGVYVVCIIEHVGACRCMWCMWCKLWCIVIRVVLYGSPPVGISPDGGKWKVENGERGGCLARGGMGGGVEGGGRGWDDKG